MAREYQITPPLQRFLSHVEIRHDGCWLWRGGTKENGYGVFMPDTRRKKFMMPHRFSFTVFVRPLEEGEQVLHSCDNPPCVNPYHLFPGTISDNMQDMLTKGRGRWQR